MPILNSKQINEFDLNPDPADTDSFVLQTSGGTTQRTTKAGLLLDTNTALSALDTRIDELDDRFVNETGDTITGTLIISGGNGSIVFQDNDGGCNAQLDYSENLDVDPASELLDTIPISAGDTAMWMVNINDGTNKRASIVLGVWDNTQACISELSTADIGDTSPVSLDGVINGTNVELRVNTTTPDWKVKAIKMRI